MAGPGWKGTRVTPAATERESGAGRGGKSAGIRLVEAGRQGLRLYAGIIPGASSDTPTPIMERKTGPGGGARRGCVYSDGWKGYDALDVSGFHHFRITHSERFADDANHIDGIENFWNQAKRRMRTSNGVRRRNSAYA